MRIKVLLLGDNPVSLVADAQLLRERGILVFTAFNMENIKELMAEVKPDLVFFDAHRSNVHLTEAYNNMVNGISFANIPVVFTLAEDDVYLITRKRSEMKDRRTIISDNMIDAIKMALNPQPVYRGKTRKISNPPTRGRKDPGAQLRIPFYS